MRKGFSLVLVLVIMFGFFGILSAAPQATVSVPLEALLQGGERCGVVDSVNMLVNGEEVSYSIDEKYDGDAIVSGGFYRFKPAGNKLKDNTYEFMDLKMIMAAVCPVTAIDTDDNILTVTDTVDRVYSYSDTTTVYKATFNTEGDFEKWVNSSESILKEGARALALDMYDFDELDATSPIIDTIFVFEEEDFDKLGIVYDETTFRVDADTGVRSIAVNSSVVYPHDQSTSIVLTPDEYTGTDVSNLIEGGVSVSVKEVIFSTVTHDYFGTSLPLHMQIAIPETATSSDPKPAVLFIFGGGFTRAPYAINNNLRWLAQQGYVVATAQYRVIPQGTAHEAVEDAKSAVRYLRAHADEFNINPDKIGMWGQSAGGWLTGITAATNGVKEFEKGDYLNYSSDIACAVNQYGLSDLTRIGMDHPIGSLALHYWTECSDSLFVLGHDSGKTVWDDWKEVEKVNPVLYIDKKSPPHLFYHGNKDGRVAPSSTLFPHNALLEAGVESTRYVLDGGGHGGPEYSQLPIMTQVKEFFDTHLKN